MAKVFSEGAKVFAKVRGYPAWPAMVQGVADSTPNKTKYHVFFYGTSETAVCKAEDLYLYAENKDRFGKPLKRKGFNEALQQIEGRAPVTMPKNDGKVGEEGDSDAEGNLVIDENPAVKYGEKKAMKRKRESGTEENDGKLPIAVSNGSIVRKRSSVPVPKRSKRESLPRETIGGSGSAGPSTPDSKTGEGPSSPNKPEIISRSGRKIKPKKFADEETFDHTSTSPVEAGISVSKIVPLDAFGAGVKRRQSSTRHSGSDAEAEKERSGEKGHDHREDIESAQNQIAGRRVRQDEEKKMMVWSEAMEKRKARLKWLKSEARMVELDALIKGHLSLSKANPEHCLGLLEDMCNLTLEPLMLKKHPHIVETIKRLRRYVGNVDAWNFTAEQKAEFSSQAGLIRNKSEFVYNKFKAMFTVPEGRTFWQVFADDVSDFQRKTQDWPMKKIYALVVDPTMENKSRKSRADESSKREQSDGESDGTVQGSGTRSSPLTNAAADSDSERAHSGDEVEEENYEKSSHHNLDSSDPTSEDADLVE
ncbi:hypothetical protein R5R35_004429 [Gryllus longicercus]|uniref:PWWP domain-containing protein n=1 Tax=Gryllus longicercus TaxID=2509291 RepID=A0AAN9YYQ3_9ORTH